MSNNSFDLIKIIIQITGIIIQIIGFIVIYISVKHAIKRSHYKDIRKILKNIEKVFKKIKNEGNINNGKHKQKKNHFYDMLEFYCIMSKDGYINKKILLDTFSGYFKLCNKKFIENPKYNNIREIFFKIEKREENKKFFENYICLNLKHLKGFFILCIIIFFISIILFTILLILKLLILINYDIHIMSVISKFYSKYFIALISLFLFILSCVFMIIIGEIILSKYSKKDNNTT